MNFHTVDLNFTFWKFLEHSVLFAKNFVKTVSRTFREFEITLNCTVWTFHSAFFYHTYFTWIHSVEISEFLPIVFLREINLKTLVVQKMPFCKFLRLWILLLAKFSPRKLLHIIQILLHSIKKSQNGNFWTSTFSKINFT